jgi:hypothetical protein
MDIDRHIRVIQPLWISRMNMFSSDKEYGYANTLQTYRVEIREPM